MKTFIVCIIAITTMLAACTPTVAEVTATVTASPQPSQTPIPTTEGQPTTLAPDPTATTEPTPLPTAVPLTTYHNSILNLTLQHPANWVSTTIEHDAIFAPTQTGLHSSNNGADGPVVHILRNQLRKMDSIGIEKPWRSIVTMFGWQNAQLRDGSYTAPSSGSPWTVIVDAQTATGDPVAATITFLLTVDGGAAAFVGVAPAAQEAELAPLFSKMFDSLQLTAPPTAPILPTYIFDLADVQGELNAAADMMMVNGRVSADQPALWHFTGEQGQQITINITPTVPILDLTFNLLDANGRSLLNNAPWDDYFAGEAIRDYSLPATGDYYVQIGGFGDTPGDFALQFQRQPAAVTRFYTSPVQHQNMQFTFDPAVGDNVVFFPPEESYQIGTFSFLPSDQDADSDNPCLYGCITLYDLEAYAADFEAFRYVIDLTQSNIENQRLDNLPTVGAAILMQTQARFLPFASGDGFRAIVSRGQDGYFVNNTSIRYDFHGITEDGRIYIHAIFPMHWPYLIDTFDPAENTNPDAIPLPPMTTDDEDIWEKMPEYNRSLEPLMDAAPNDEFTPDLSLLDALLASLQIE